jgi:3-oxoacyl-[acyl-carrier protein] reductase
MPVAIVTGASRGIGRAVSIQLARDGFNVGVNYTRGKDDAETVVREIQKLGRLAIHVQADVSQEEQVERMFSEVEEKLGKVSVLVNNAGVMNLAKISEAKVDLFDQTFAVNVRGVFNTLHQASTRLQEGGRIINLSTSAIALAPPSYGRYTASKAAVESMSYVFAKELRGRHITVNCVAPGPVATELFLRGKSVEQVQQATKAPPLERLGEPEDVARAVSFLAGEKGAWVNAQVIRVNGGII